MTKLYYIKSTSFDPYRNLALEESLMREYKDGIILYLWQNSDCVVIGRNQNPVLECDIASMTCDSVPVVRRKSGGGAVFHDINNLNFTFIYADGVINKEHIFDILKNALASFNITATLSGRNDILVDGKKCSGSAYLTRAGVHMHHGTFLIDTDTDKLSKYLTVSTSKLGRHKVSSVGSRVVNLKSINSIIDAERLIGAILSSTLQAINEHEYESLYVNKDELDKLTIEYSSADFIYGPRGKLAFCVKGVFDWGEALVEYDKANGKYTNVRIYTDSLECGDVFERIAKAIIFGEKPTDDIVDKYNDLINLLEKTK